jgi:hypothetical protein
VDGVDRLGGVGRAGAVVLRAKRANAQESAMGDRLHSGNASTSWLVALTRSLVPSPKPETAVGWILLMTAEVVNGRMSRGRGDLRRGASMHSEKKWRGD